MRNLRLFFVCGLLGGLMAFAGPVSAQQGTISGRATLSTTGDPVDGIQVLVVGPSVSTGTMSNETGVFQIQVPPGTYTVTTMHPAFATETFENVSVTSGGNTTLDITITYEPVGLKGILISGTRNQVGEKQVESAGMSHIIGTTEIEEKMVQSVSHYLRPAPGVDIIEQGIQSTNVAIRGFNNIFSGSLHALTDHRLAGVPSLRVNLLHFIPSTDADIERMEVVLGPGSALYGPNTANGVLHILTRSPLDPASEGTTFTVGGGERSVFQGSFRTSHLINSRLGVKLSGQYLRGNDWEYTDAGEAAARAGAIADPARCQTILGIRGYSSGIAQLGCTRVGNRDFDIERYGFEARGDYQFAEDGTMVLTYGRTSATGIELTGLGAGQTEDWIYQFFQARANKGRFFTQAYLNTSDAGDSWLLRDGVPLVDKSKLFVAQAQHGFDLMDGKQDFTYGVDIFRTRPNTEGSINGVYEDADDINEWGVYLQSKTALHEKFDLILAGRVDDHSMLPKKVWSPRAALVYKPTEFRSARISYNRAFSTPTSLNFFLDISAGLAPSDALAALGYTVRAHGTGPDGYGFRNSSGQFYGMKSPLHSDPSQTLPISQMFMWPAAVGVLQAQGIIDPQIAGLLNSLDPSSLGIMTLNTSNFQLTPLEQSDVPDVPGIRESYTETFGAGWSGVIGRRFQLAADLYYTKKKDFISPLLTQNPLLTLNGQDIGALLQSSPLPTILVQQFMAGGADLATATAMATETITALATGLAQVPTGVLASDDVASQQADLIVTYRNIGDVDFWGADLAFSYFLDDKWTLSGSYSHVSDDWFEFTDRAPLALNAPKDKGSVGVAYRNALQGFNAEVLTRFSAEFPAESAGYVGTKCLGDHDGGFFEEDCIESAVIVDLNMGYKIPDTPATLQLAVTNVFDTPYRSFVGVPDIGRFAMVRMKYDLF